MLKNIKNSQFNCVRKRILVIRMIKSYKSKKYFFEEKFVRNDYISLFFKKKTNKSLLSF